MHSKPQLLAWVTCDGVHIDPTSGKHTLLGIFTNIHTLHFPFVHPLMYWFLTLSDCSAGEHRLKISMGFEKAAPRPLLERPFRAHSPMDRINLVNEIRNLVFPEPGEYSLLIEVDNEVLLATSIVITSGNNPHTN